MNILSSFGRERSNPIEVARANDYLIRCTDGIRTQVAAQLKEISSLMSIAKKDKRQAPSKDEIGSLYRWSTYIPTDESVAAVMALNAFKALKAELAWSGVSVTAFPAIHKGKKMIGLTFTIWSHTLADRWSKKRSTIKKAA